MALHSTRPPLVSQGVSFGALGSPFLAHLRGLLALEPRTRVVLHVRTNHVKHAISFLRTSCPGQLNHFTPRLGAGRAAGRAAAGGGAATGDVGDSPPLARLYVPPALLLQRAALAARAQSKVLADALALGSGRLAYTLAYEAMQLDLPLEIGNLLRALGVPSGAVGAAVARAAAARLAERAESTPGGGAMLKAAAEDSRLVLANFGEAEALARSLPCMHAMLLAATPTVFPLDACAADLERMPQQLERLLVEGSREGRARLALNASECRGEAGGET